MKTIDILCPLYNASKDFETLLKGINQQENIIIKNIIFPVTESTDNTFELAKKVPNAIVHKIKKTDFSHSLTREEEIQYATSDVVIFMTQDVYLSDKYALEKLADCINGKVIHAFSRQLTKSKGIEKYTREKNYPEKSYIMSKKDIEKEQIKAFYSSDACAAYDRKKFLELGGFDGKIFKVSEDMYFCRKALLAGYSIMYCADSVVTHSHKLTLKQLYKRYYDIGVFFAQNPEFKKYKSIDSGLKLAMYILKQSIKHFDIPVLIRWFPDMLTRYLGKKRGEKINERYNISRR